MIFLDNVRVPRRNLVGQEGMGFMYQMMQFQEERLYGAASSIDGLTNIINYGFGYMRLPMKDGEVDIEQTSRMVDTFLDAGFNYFDTAHGYLQGKSE